MSVQFWAWSEQEQQQRQQQRQWRREKKGRKSSNLFKVSDFQSRQLFLKKLKNGWKEYKRVQVVFFSFVIEEAEEDGIGVWQKKKKKAAERQSRVALTLAKKKNTWIVELVMQQQREQIHMREHMFLDVNALDVNALDL